MNSITNQFAYSLVTLLITKPILSADFCFTRQFFYQIRGEIFNLIFNLIHYSTDNDIVDTVKTIQIFYERYRFLLNEEELPPSYAIFMYRFLISLEFLYGFLKNNRIQREKLNKIMPANDRGPYLTPERGESMAYFYHRSSEHIRSVVFDGKPFLF